MYGPRVGLYLYLSRPIYTFASLVHWFHSSLAFSYICYWIPVVGESLFWSHLYHTSVCGDRSAAEFVGTLWEHDCNKKVPWVTMVNNDNFLPRSSANTFSEPNPRWSYFLGTSIIYSFPYCQGFRRNVLPKFTSLRKTLLWWAVSILVEV